MIRAFEQDLDKLRTRLIRMGSLVEEQAEFSFRALAEGNKELAKIVVERDDKVDKLDLKIDKQCQRIFALSQPVARDLRLLLAAIKINNEFERIGDIAAHVAHAVLEEDRVSAIGKDIGVDSLISAVQKMLTSSIDSFINNDPDLAAHIVPSDSTIDQLGTALQSRLVEIMEEKQENVAPGARMLLVIHSLERMSGHATNIAENVIFMIRAKLVRHKSVNTDGIDVSDLISKQDGD